jgi:hypothetical protein
MKLEPPASLFGVPQALRRADADQLLTALGALWEQHAGLPPGELDLDLASLEGLFKPTARGATLRKRVVGLGSSLAPSSRFLRPPLVLGSGKAQTITPEGRILFEVLREASEAGSDTVVLEPDAAYAAEHKAYVLYRDWATQRLRDVLGVSEGRDSLRIPSIAAVLLLLVNGSTSPDRALRRLDEAADRERLDRALARVGLAFWDALDTGNKHDARAFSLYQGYAWTEAARRFPRALSANPWYVHSDAVDDLLDGLVSELSRPQRYISTDLVRRGFKSLLDAYQREQPVLAGLGMSHYRAAETRRLQERLEVLLGQRPERS